MDPWMTQVRVKRPLVEQKTLKRQKNLSQLYFQFYQFYQHQNLTKFQWIRPSEKNHVNQDVQGILLYYYYLYKLHYYFF